ncbi:MAG: glycoside hydrolase family 3 C-terminal domain-containing protein [Firmicutes bacterium]|nr:glycoside hydrolase family 3 C-terminal domain-containing protein [Bacillota bacterium]
MFLTSRTNFPDKGGYVILNRIRLRQRVFLVLVLIMLTVVTVILNPSVYALPYQDPSVPVEDRITDLLSRMNVDEKAGQMIQAERGLASAADVKTYFLGSILSGGGSVPNPNNPTGWCDMIDNYETQALATRLGIPIIYGADAVHGHNNVYGATIFPHNIGMGATRDAGLVERMGQITAHEVRSTGVHWTFAPCIAVPQNEKWGRTYEGYSEDTALVSQMGVAFVKGVQGANYPADLTRNDKIAACIKHYIGDGATDGGINEGNATMTEEVLRQKYLPPYTAAINAGARTVMISFNLINNVECHMNTHLITDILKNELGFDGFVISDFNGVDDNDRSNYRNAVKLAVNAGIDMIMVSNKWRECLANLKDLINTGEVSQSRVDDAVRRILRVKFQLGLFEKPKADRTLMSAFGSTAHRTVAREAVRKSLVLLKNNNNILPLSKTGKKIFVAGKCADNIGYQCGGWTISWQGMSGNITPGTTILQGIRNVATGDTITYNSSGIGAAGNDVAIVVIGETPYAETQGDNQTLALDSTDINTLNNVKSSGVPVVVILISGRPLIVTDYIPDWAAFVAAWLPGTEGQGVAEVLFGDYNFSGKLPVVWPQSVSQLPISPGDGKTPLYEFGAGLTYGTNSTPTPTRRVATPTPTQRVATPTPTRRALTPTPTRRVTPTPTRGGVATPTPTRRINTPTPTRVITNTPTPTRMVGGYVVSYAIQSDWGNGATINVTIINNTAAAVNGWTLAFTFPGNQTITNLWNGTYTQSGASVSVKDAGFNASIPANGGSVNFGFNLNYSGSNAKPASFTLNGTACQVQ